MSLPLIIACGVLAYIALVLTVAAALSTAVDDDGPVSLNDALRDGWGDEDLDFDWPEPAGKDCTGGDDPAAYRSAATSRPPCPPVRLAKSPVHKLPEAEARATA